MITEKQRMALNATIGKMMNLSDEAIREIMEKESDSGIARFLYDNDAVILNLPGSNLGLSGYFHASNIRNMLVTLKNTEYSGFSTNTLEKPSQEVISDGGIACLAA